MGVSLTGTWSRCWVRPQPGHAVHTARSGTSEPGWVSRSETRTARRLRRLAEGVGETLEARFMFGRSADLNFYLEAITDVGTAKTEAYSMNRRLVIRLGRTHAVSAAFSRCLSLWDEGGTHIGTSVTKRTSGHGDQMDQFLPGFDARKVARQEAQEGFLDAATGLVGSPVKPLIA